MQNFLKQTRKFVNVKEPICLVLGNESCDLDSAVSAISLAYFYQNSTKLNSHSFKYLPILNIPKRDYPLKTEVKYIFEENSIKEEFLTFKDELSDDFLKNNKFVLVDHHVSPWLKRCIAIYDHRPKDAFAIIPDDCELHLSLEGSCATLVAEEFINSKMVGESEKDILNLLRSTIILDTVNFSEIAARATPKDVAICLALEEALNLFDVVQSRDKVFESLINARADVSSLNATQLLRKDFKILISSKNKNIKVALPGFPLPVHQYITKLNAEKAVREFAKEFDCSVVILLGMYVQPEHSIVQRDFGIINISNYNLFDLIHKRLLTLDEPKLCVEHCTDCNFMSGSFYKHNNKVTRKHILPIVKSVIEQ